MCHKHRFKIIMKLIFATVVFVVHANLSECKLNSMDVKLSGARQCSAIVFIALMDFILFCSFTLDLGVCNSLLFTTDPVLGRRWYSRACSDSTPFGRWESCRSTNQKLFWLDRRHEYGRHPCTGDSTWWVWTLFNHRLYMCWICLRIISKGTDQNLLAIHTLTNSCFNTGNPWHYLWNAKTIECKYNWSIYLAFSSRQNNEICTGFVFSTKRWSICWKTTLRSRTTWKLHEARVRWTYADDWSRISTVSVVWALKPSTHVTFLHCFF